jgi:hypothetical protein
MTLGYQFCYVLLCFSSNPNYGSPLFRRALLNMYSVAIISSCITTSPYGSLNVTGL